MAVFQKKWDVGPSFMTVLGLIFNVVAMLMGGLLRELNLRSPNDFR
jgi:hypothetical protein